MAPLPDVPKVVRVALSGNEPAPFVWLTRFFIQYTGTAPTNSDLNTFVAAVITAYNSNIRSLVDTSTNLTEVTATDLSSVTSAVGASATTSTGTRSGVPVAADSCLVLSYEIARRYRGGHPRGYWRMGVAVDLANSATWGASFISAASTGLGAFFTAVLAAGWSGAGTLTQVNVSFFKSFTVVISPTTGRARNVPTLRGAPVVDTVTSRIPRASVGTQRRREAFVD